MLSFTRDTPIIKKKKVDEFGYHRVSIRISPEDKESKQFYVHVLVANQFIPNSDSQKTQVNHINRIPADNNLKNLEWVTPLENSHHSIKMFLKENHGKHWKGKITKQDADFMRANFKKPYKATDFSRMFNLDLSTVYSALRGETWKI